MGRGKALGPGGKKKRKGGRKGGTRGRGSKGSGREGGSQWVSLNLAEVPLFVPDIGVGYMIRCTIFIQKFQYFKILFKDNCLL